MRHKTIAAALAIAALAAVPVTPAAAATNDSACGGTLGSNCGTLAVSVTVDDSTCFTTSSEYRCVARGIATATAYAWLAPGEMSLGTSHCGSTTASIALLGGGSATRDCTWWVSAPRWGCTSAWMSATLRFTATTGAPRDLHASDSRSVCDPTPIPTGPKVTLYQHNDLGGGYFTVSGNVSDFAGRWFSNGVGLNDQVSSARVRSDCSATLHGDAGYTGGTHPLPAGDTNALPYFNDVASSISLNCVFN